MVEEGDIKEKEDMLTHTQIKIIKAQLDII